MINASNLFVEGNIGESLKEVKSIESLQHKKHINGSLVTSNSINKTNNGEESLFVRMVRLYNEYYKNEDVRVGFIMREVLKSSNLEQLDSDIDKNIQGEIASIEASRKLEERRQAEIREELDDMRGNFVHTPSASVNYPTPVNKPRGLFKKK